MVRCFDSGSDKGLVNRFVPAGLFAILSRVPKQLLFIAGMSSLEGARGIPGAIITGMWDGPVLIQLAGRSG